MTQTTTNPTRRAGLDRLDAVALPEGDYAYYAEEVSGWYLVSESEISELGESLLAGEDDAYSLWCASSGEAVSDLEHDQLDRIANATDADVTYRCQCGTATGVRCDWTGPREELVHIRHVYDSDRGSAQASGTYTSGAYAHSLYVTSECAEMLRYEWEDGEPTDREDPFVRVVGPAYEG